MKSREQMTQQLTAARGLVRAYFETLECPWEMRFHQDQQACRQCGDSHVCQWLFEQDPDPDLSAFAEGQIREALSFAAGYLQGRMIEAGHEPTHCDCATCCWVREALKLTEAS